MQINAKGEKVIELQSYLTDLGYGDLLDPEKIDGKFGIHTKNSVMTYQKDFGLSVDGKVGPQTWSSLCEQISLLPTTFPRGTATTGVPDRSSSDIQEPNVSDKVSQCYVDIWLSALPSTL